MVKRNLHKVFAWLLVLVFVSGQISLFTHHHAAVKCYGQSPGRINKKGYHEKKLEPKCLLCDAIIHQLMLNADSSSFNCFTNKFFSQGEDICLLYHTVFNLNYPPRGPPLITNTRTKINQQTKEPFKKSNNEKYNNINFTA